MSDPDAMLDSTPMGDEKTTERRRARGPSAVVRWTLVAVWMVGIFLMSSAPASMLPSGAPDFGHFIEYSVLGGLLFYALSPAQSIRKAVLLAVIVASLYGITDEMHQYLTPGRNPQVTDWLLDTVSALLGALVVMYAQKARCRSGKSDG